MEYSKPLYPGARLTEIESTLLLMTFMMKHSLTREALKDLLTIIELHCLTPNLFRPSLNLFNGFFKERAEDTVQKHYFCCFCDAYHGVKSPTVCNNCQKNDEGYFMYIPIIDQLQTSLSGMI